MYRMLIIILMLLACFLPLIAAADDGTVPDAANSIAKEMDKQIMKRLKVQKMPRESLSIVTTASVFLNNMDRSSPLARQMAEELAGKFMSAGYRVLEIRKDRELVMTARGGERILTRNLSRLANRNVTSSAILTGTYTMSRDNVRFNLKLLSTSGNEMLAAASASVPITSEIADLLADRNVTGSPAPSVYTRLR